MKICKPIEKSWNFKKEVNKQINHQKSSEQFVIKKASEKYKKTLKFATNLGKT